MPQTPQPSRTPKPGSTLPSGKALEDLFAKHFGMPPPPSPEDKYSPEELLKLMKEGKIKQLWPGRYGPADKNQLMLEDKEWGQVESHPKLNPANASLQWPEAQQLYSELLTRLYPTPTATPTPTPERHPAMVPLNLRRLFYDYFNYNPAVVPMPVRVR